MRKLVRATPFKLAGRNTQPTYDPESNQQKLKSWTSRIGNLTSSANSKVYLSQLGVLINYYNRQVEDTTKPINWSEWSSRIITPGLVDKVKQNYEEQSKQEYDLEKIFTDVFNRDSKAIDEINSEMAFHTAIWLEKYVEYVIFLSDLSTVSSPQDYTLTEWYDMNQGMAERVDSHLETHSWLPGARDDVDTVGYVNMQFSWGKRMFSYFRHPTDDYKEGRATKNAMGR